MKKLFIPFLISLIFSLHAAVNFRTSSSTLQISSGAQLFLNSEIPNCSGVIARDVGGMVMGQSITFENGYLKEGPALFRLTAHYEPCCEKGSIILDGGKVLSGQQGVSNQILYVSGNDNRLEGVISVYDDLVLQDVNTSLTCAILNTFPCNIQLNGGIISLATDLHMADEKYLIGPGTFRCNGYRLMLGGEDIEWETPLYYDEANDFNFSGNVLLSNMWTFSGNCGKIFGNGNVLDLGDQGCICVERGSSVLFKNVVLKNVSEGNFRCLDNAGKIYLDNVDIYFSSDYTFSIGSFKLSNNVYFHGPGKFIYKSPIQSTIDAKSSLVLDSGLTFSYDPGIMRKDLLAFEDATSQLWLDDARLHATLTGMQLENGTLIFSKNSYVSSEQSALLDEGITLGNDSIDHDCVCQILAGVIVTVQAGSIKYRNVGGNSWYMGNNVSTFSLGGGCNLYLYENLNLGLGTFIFKSGSGLYSYPGKTILGTVNGEGILNYKVLS